MDRGPRTGVTGAVSLSDLDFVEGGGAYAWGWSCLGKRIVIDLEI